MENCCGLVRFIFFVCFSFADNFRNWFYVEVHGAVHHDVKKVRFINVSILIIMPMIVKVLSDEKKASHQPGFGSLSGEFVFRTWNRQNNCLNSSNHSKVRPKPNRSLTSRYKFSLTILVHSL